MNSERRYLLAIFLSFLVLLVFYTPLLRKPQPQPLTNENPAISKPQTVAPSAALQQAEARTKTSRFYPLENELFSIRLTSEGAGVSELVLKDQQVKNNNAEHLIKTLGAETPAFVVEIQNQKNSFAHADFKFEPESSNNQKISFVYEVPGEIRMRKYYELIPGKFAFNIKLEIENLGRETLNAPLEFINQIYFGKDHSRYNQDQLESFMVPRMGKIKVVKEQKIRKNPVAMSEPILWQALTKHYFTVIVKPEKEAVSVETQESLDRESLEAALRFAPETINPGGKLETTFLVYAGPEYYENLKHFGFEETLVQGIWGFFRHWLFLSLRFCQRITGNYGLAILLMTLLIKGLFSPFTHMSFESMKKMQVIQPKLKAIQNQFKNDPTRLNKEMMELYKRHKVNPMGGCLPMVIQIPIFISFYQVLAQFVELKGVSFLWIKDLTQPDRLAKIPYLGFDLNLLPLLMIGTMIWQQKVTPQQSIGSPEQAKMMQFMPIIFGFMFYPLPSGLVLYWTLNNLLTVTHQMLFHHKTKQAEE